MRVVSLLPSATEIVLAIAGWTDGGHRGTVSLVGRSHECDWPADCGLEQVPVLTRARTRFESSAQVDAEVRARLAAGEALYELDAEQLAALKPDLIITQDLCDVCSIDLAAVRAVVAEIGAGGEGRPEVLSLNPGTVEGVFDDVLHVGRAIGMEREALGLVVDLRERMFRAAEFVTPFAARPVVAFLEWTDPLFIGGHWTPQLIERAGGSHPLNPTVPIAGAGAAAGMAGESMTLAGRSVRIPPEVLAASRPEVVIVCPCGLSLEEAMKQTREVTRSAWWTEMMEGACHRLGAALGATSVLGAEEPLPPRIAVVDGNQMFNRPGPRLVDAFEFLVGYLNDRPELIPRGFPWSPWTG